MLKEPETRKSYIVEEKGVVTDSSDIEVFSSRCLEQNDQYVKRLIVDNVKGVGIFTVPDFMLYEANQRFLEYLPSTCNYKETVYGCMFNQLFPGFEGSDEERAWKAAAENHTCYIREKQSVIGGDRICYFDYTLTPIASNGQVQSIILVLEDVTEQVLNKKRIADQEKNEVLRESLKLKDEFLYLITHEFRTPLTVIKSAIQTMELKYRDMPDKAVRYIKTIKQNVNRQIRLVNNLLDITRISSGKIKLIKGNYDIVFLTKSIVESIQSIAQQKKINVVFSTELQKKVICFDEEKFERILLNLLSNSIKFTRQEKMIYINLYSKKLRNKHMVCIEVRDEGIGIPKEK